MPKGGGLVEPDTDLFVWDAAMRTSAAPTYFPVYNGYVDGGVVANDPSALAVTKVFAHYSHVTARNVTVLSLGNYLPLACSIYQRLKCCCPEQGPAGILTICS